MAEQRRSGTFNNVFKFNGKELDSETDLYYYGARYYNPRTSVWLSVDPMAEKYPGWSPYNYALQNPIYYVDPDGRDIIPFLIRFTEGLTMKGKFEKGFTSRVFNNFMKDFVKTSVGENFMSNFMKSGQSLFGYTAKDDGKYSNYTVKIMDVNMQDINEAYNYMQRADGQFFMKKIKKLELQILLFMLIQAEQINTEPERFLLTKRLYTVSTH